MLLSLHELVYLHDTKFSFLNEYLEIIKLDFVLISCVLFQMKLHSYLSLFRHGWMLILDFQLRNRFYIPVHTTRFFCIDTQFFSLLLLHYNHQQYWPLFVLLDVINGYCWWLSYSQLMLYALSMTTTQLIENWNLMGWTGNTICSWTCGCCCCSSWKI